MRVKKYITILLLIINSLGFAQENLILHQICDSINSHKEISYNMVREKRGLFSSDIGYINYKCSFRLYPKDTLSGVSYNVFLQEFAKEKIYNGKYYSQIIYNDSLVKLLKICPETQKYHSEIFSNYGYYTSPFMIAKYLQAVLNTPDVVKTTIQKNKKGILINCRLKQDYWFSDEGALIKSKKLANEIIENKITILIDSISFLPITYRRDIKLKLDSEIFSGYSEYHYSNYSFDIKYSIEPILKIPKDFKIKYYKVRYKEINQTSGIKPNEIGTHAKTWSLVSTLGDSVSFNKFLGKPLILEFGFFGCHPCMESIPILNELQTKYGNQVNIVFINVTPLDMKKAAKLKKAYEFEFKLLINGGDVAKMYGQKAFPKTYFIDSNGIIQNIAGFSTDSTENWETNLLKLK